MKIIYLTCLLNLSAGINLIAQDTLFHENFQTAPSQFTLNTSDVNSVNGYNHWVINNSYPGGSGSGTVCGFPVTFTIPNTPSQPSAITGSPNSTYLHTVSDLSISNGINNCCFLAADGFCFFAENYFSKMSADVNTTGYDTVKISFWWLCVGGANSYGELYYSINGGAAWTKHPGIPKYNATSNWSNIVLTDPAFVNQPTLRFGFRFVNNTALNASDPGFGIDDITVTGIQNVTVPGANFIASATTFCEETCISFTDLSTNNPTSWQWYFPGAMPLTSTLQNPTQICYSDTGFFDVTLIASNTFGSDTLTLAAYIHSIANPPKPIITANGDTLCTAFNSSYTYQWFFNGSTAIPGATNYCYVAAFPGTYSVQIVDVTGCKSTSEPFVVTGVINAEATGGWVLVYPTLANEQFQIIKTGILNEFYLVQLFNAEGKEIHNEKFKSGQQSLIIKVSDIEKGIYLLKITGNQGIQTKKVAVY